ncbi:MAG: hypothetical protein AVDCRST_MAG60-248, partial [uncultured Nocardioides sp.]
DVPPVRARGSPRRRAGLGSACRRGQRRKRRPVRRRHGRDRPLRHSRRFTSSSSV